MGIRVSSDIEYTDEITMLKAMEGPAGPVTTKGAWSYFRPSTTSSSDKIRR